MTHKPATIVGLLLALAAIAAACSSDETASDTEQAPLTVTDVGAGWTLEVPEDWTVEGTFGDPVEQKPGCVVDQFSIKLGTARTHVALVGPGCSASSVNRGNGEPPTFGSADQLLDGGTDIERSDTAIGPLTIATVAYFECTNECNDYNPPVGLIELSDPADPSLVAMVISNDRACTSRSDIEFIAQHLRPS